MNEGKKQPDQGHQPLADGRLATATDEEALYQRFGQWLEPELEKLVARWIHLAAPNANRPRPMRRKPR